MTLEQFKGWVAAEATKAAESYAEAAEEFRRMGAIVPLRAIERGGVVVKAAATAGAWDEADAAMKDETMTTAERARAYVAWAMQSAIACMDGASGSSCGYTRAAAADVAKARLAALSQLTAKAGRLEG